MSASPSGPLQAFRHVMVNTGAGDLKAKAGKCMAFCNVPSVSAPSEPFVCLLCTCCAPCAENFLKTVEILSPLTDAQVICLHYNCPCTLSAAY